MTRAIAAACLMVVLAGCATPEVRSERQTQTAVSEASVKQPSSPPAQPPNPAGQPPDASALPPVRMTFTGLHRERPPKVRLSFEVMLRNEAREPRWYLLPDKLTDTGEPQERAVEGVEVYKLGDPPRVPVGHFMGKGGFHALLLPPGGEVKLERFPIMTWQEPPDRAAIHVAIARAFTVGGEPAGEWFGLDPTSAPRADARADGLAEQVQVVAERWTPKRELVPVVLSGEAWVSLDVNLKPAK